MIKDMRLETERLIIRPYKEDDLQQCFQLMQDKELFKYLDMDVMSFQEYKGLFNWLIKSYDKGFGEDFKYSFNITLKDSGKHIGWCGIGILNYDNSKKEIYYLIGKEHWGKGYAKEASTALLQYSFSVIELNEIVALCKLDNFASRKVIESMGFKFKYIVAGLSEDFEFYNGEPFYALTREEYFDNLKDED